MRLFSYPFRITPNGSIATVEQYSSQYTAEQIAMITLTEKGERQLIPNFGLVDPTFLGVNVGDLSLQVSLYGPDVSISNLSAYYEDDSILTVKVEFTDDSI